MVARATIAAAGSAHRIHRARGGAASTAVALVSDCGDTPSSANRRSWVDWNRAPGFFSRQRSTIRVRPAGTFAVGPERLGVVSETIATITSACESPRNARRPESISYRIAPNAKMSAR